MSNCPPYEETRKLVIAAGHSEEWLKEKMREVNDNYGGSIKEMAFLAWLAAAQNGVQVAEIKASEGRGLTITLAELTRTLVREQMGMDQGDRTMYAVEGLVVNVRSGQSSKGKDKISFTLLDGTGRATVSCWGEAVSVFANARIAEGDYVSIPQANVYAFDTQKDDFWWTLSLPPFGSILKLDKNGDSVFKDPNERGAKEGDAVQVTGILTSLEQQSHDACSKCQRWYDEEDDSEHVACREEAGDEWRIYKQISHKATLVSFTGQQYGVRFNHHQPKPKVAVGKDRVQVRGFWTKTGGIAALSLRVLPPVKRENAPASPAPAPAVAPSASAANDAASTPSILPHEAPSEVPPEVMTHFERFTKDMGGTNRVLILVNQAANDSTLLPSVKDASQRKKLFEGLLRRAVDQKRLRFADTNEKTVEWVGA